MFCLYLSLFLSAFFGLIGGSIAALRRARFTDFLSMTIATSGISMPVFWLALILILLFSVYVPLFPVSGRISPHIYIEPITLFYTIDTIIAADFTAFFNVIWHLILPAIVLGTIPAAFIARMMRASMIEVMEEDFVRTAKAKGLKPRKIIFFHALRNAFLPTLTVIALEFGYLLGGAVITETIFAWPGIGRWLFLAVQARDFQAVQGGVLLIATVFVLINLLTDLLYAWLDPRIRYDL